MVKQRDSHIVKTGGRFLIFKECRYDMLSKAEHVTKVTFSESIH